jgi:hypothetical protein
LNSLTSQFSINYSKTWLIWNSRDQKKVFKLCRTSIIQNFVKQLANNSLEKLVLFLSVSCATVCYAITVTNYHFTCCSVAINVTFNTVKLYPFLKKSAKNKRWMQQNTDAGKLLFWNIWWELWKLSLQGRFFFRIRNYQGFRNKQLNL